MLSLNYKNINNVMTQILKLSCASFSYVNISYVLAPGSALLAVSAKLRQPTVYMFKAFWIIISFRYSLMHKKTEKCILRFFIYKKFKKQFYFFTCILPGYVFNESPKEFWKNSNFENMRAGFLRR